jgi:hypothetical protein
MHTLESIPLNALKAMAYDLVVKISDVQKAQSDLAAINAEIVRRYNQVQQQPN